MLIAHLVIWYVLFIYFFNINHDIYYDKKSIVYQLKYINLSNSSVAII